MSTPHAAGWSEVGIDRPDAILSPLLVLDGKGHIRLLNSAACEAFQSSCELAGGQDIRQWIPAFGSKLATIVLRHVAYQVSVIVLETEQGPRQLVGLRATQETTPVLRHGKTMDSLISHEFKTPLSTVLSSVYLLSQYASPERSAQVEKHVKRIIAAAASVTRMIDALMLVRRIDEGTMKASPSRFRLTELIGQVSGHLGAELKAGQRIEHAHEGADDFVNDPEMIMQTLMQLLSNAVKFSPAETVISVRSEHDGKQARLRVCNEAELSEEEQPFLFDKFFKATGQPNIQGLGLGLYIARSYAVLCGGTLELDADGRQVCFVLSIPDKPEKP